MVPIVRGVLLSAVYASLATAGCSLPFDVREASVDSIHNALFTGMTTCRDVVSAFIARIEAFNPTVNAVLALNPDVLDIADGLDARIAAGNTTGKLFCVPILLKDNFDAAGMPTTGSCRALADLHPADDAPTVRAFKDAGAVILGKTNLHELALEGLSVSSHGGQTVNPYDHTRTPGGSSGGTGAAIAANLAVFGTGTDTVNSLRSPASANNLFSFRPTWGLISRAGVIPCGYTQDTLGAITRNVKDMATALTVMASVGYDAGDNSTAFIPPEVVGKDYSSALYGGSLKGKRLGLVLGFHNYTESPETNPVNSAMADMVTALRAAGAEIVNVTDPVYNATALLASTDVQQHEYRQLIDDYLGAPGLNGSFPRSFFELYEGTKDYLVIPSQYGYIDTAIHGSTTNNTYLTKLHNIQNLKMHLHSTFQELKLDAFIYPQQKNLVVKIGSPSQVGRNGILAAVTGVPVVMVPAGWSSPSEDAPIGVPIGMEILGLPWTEDKLLNIAQHISELVPRRRMPKFANRHIEVRQPYEAVPSITPNTENISPNYPLGRIR
ncbi:amidase signature domain-containing protein [Stachybotrys elegans]|uniref:Amidase signature domain-containing protein n=1 Tax=Stachybotrys elegans TaxID=80388 RepID=A0A8K0SH38_9HYPO|nr:amidase signature domain-containing protein [Stachybotrys elegans]